MVTNMTIKKFRKKNQNNKLFPKSIVKITNGYAISYINKSKNK